ncbi:MAG: hypothetical protein LBH32_02710, partial [Dysgonamonadaceae bacterium]|nr:hypothetical protein [Dysgonamonadaceae bacterium]
IPDSLRIGGLRVAVSGNIFDSKAVNRCETANDDKSLSANRIEIKEIKAENIVSVLIGQGELYGGGSEGFSREFSVIKTELEWKALKAKLNLRNNITDVFAEKNIDFSRYQVIFVIDEVKGNGGWSIDITDITENDDNIVVSIENLKTGDATTAISQPFQLVKISSSDKPVIFNDLTLGKHILPLVNFEFPEDCVRSIATLQPDSLYVINSDEEFNKYFICGSNPIDFSKKTLLFSLGETNYGIYKISTELLKESNEYSLTVDIQLTISCVIDRWNIALITDKINTQNVILNLNKHF